MAKYKIAYKATPNPDNPKGPRLWWVWVATVGGGIIATLSKVPFDRVLEWLEINGFMTR